MTVNATAVWRVRPSGSNTNGGGYDAGISGAGTDYSQQNSAQASGTAGTAAGTTAFSDTVAAAFTSAMVGNALYITGTGLTTGFYFCTAFTDASHITLDRSPGTGTTGTWHLGGGWADFWTNGGGTNGTTGPLVPGNIVYILGSGIPNPASYTYDYTCNVAWQPTSGNSTAGKITFAADPSTPSYNGTSTGGMPCINIQQSIGNFGTSQFDALSTLWWVVGAALSHLFFFGGSDLYLNLLIDELAQDVYCWRSGANELALNCECFSSTTTGGGTTPAVYWGSGSRMIGCTIHDWNGPGIGIIQTTNSFINTIVAKNHGNGVLIPSNSVVGTTLLNLTIDGNTGNGLEVADQQALSSLTAINLIISNHTTAGKYGLAVDAGTTAANNLVKQFVDYISFYNNTTNYNAISAGPHDTALSSNPYVAQSTENYTLA